MKSEKFPVTIAEKGVSAVIRKTVKIKGGKKLNYFIVEYVLLGKRKQVWRSDLGEAKAVAREACIKIANGDQSSLELRNGERLAYTRAVGILAPFGVQIDSAARDVADALAILGGKASITEACRDWIKRNSVQLPKITVAVACAQLQLQAVADGKSQSRLKQLANVLDQLAEAFNCEVHTLTPKLIADYLTALTLAERSKRNHRDVIGFFNRWLILRGFLPKGTDLLEGVQTYSARKLGEIEIYTPEEVKLLLTMADKQILPFLAIGAFAGLRHSEIVRLDWSEVELADGDGDSFIEIRADKAKTLTRRIVPVKNNLKAWLAPHKKDSGKVCSFDDATKQLSKLAEATGMVWKKTPCAIPALATVSLKLGMFPACRTKAGIRFK